MGGAGDVALGFLTKGMYYRESIEISFKAKGLTPKYVFESDSTFQIIQAVQAGICCAIMPLNNGLEALSDNLEILPIAETQVDLTAGAHYAPAGAGINPGGKMLRRGAGDFWLRPVLATTSDILQSNAPRSGVPKIPTDSITISILTTIKLITPACRRIAE